jgi:hypothetical protein
MELRSRLHVRKRIAECSLGGLRKNCSAGRKFTSASKAAKQSKVLTAALKRCAAKALRHPKSRNPMEFFRNLLVRERRPAAGADFSTSFHRFEFRFAFPDSMSRGHS